MNHIGIYALLTLSGISGFLFSLYTHSQIPPASHSPTTFVSNLAHDPEAGKKIFNEFCATCHAPTPAIQTPAPRLGETQKWQQLKKAGLPTLLKITLHGTKIMPPRGGCFECSDEQIRATIEYMLKT